MAPPLPQSTVTNILNLRRSGFSIREIARRLGVHRETVGKYVSRLESQVSRGGERSLAVTFELTPVAARRTGPPSCCEPHRDLIIEKVNQGLTAQLIYQHLLSEQGFTARYHSVRRYVAKLLNGKTSASEVTTVPLSPPSDSSR